MMATALFEQMTRGPFPGGGGAGATCLLRASKGWRSLLPLGVGGDTIGPGFSGVSVIPLHPLHYRSLSTPLVSCSVVFRAVLPIYLLYIRHTRCQYLLAADLLTMVCG
jgi:hypothetical protein